MLSKQEDFDRDVKRVLQEVNGEEIPLDFLVDIEQRLDQLEKRRNDACSCGFLRGLSWRVDSLLDFFVEARLPVW